ncbi:hypothetical protein Syun_011890 [Stephania yunnanensis]|uniref:Uncharacterized protein n=1 Tax=Stephania yunnanensis TaxID=152371 RepID=A0AAP0JZE9_9MAGN
MQKLGRSMHVVPPNTSSTHIFIDDDSYHNAETQRGEVGDLNLRGCRQALADIHASFMGREVLWTRRLDFDFFDRIKSMKKKMSI